MKSLKVEIRWTLYHIKKTQKLRKKIAVKYHGHYIMIGCYTGSNNPITFLHVDCARTFKRGLEDFKKCKIKCKYKAKKVTKQQQKERMRHQPHINQYNKDKGQKLYTKAFDKLLKSKNYKRLSKYTNVKSKVLIKHSSTKCLYYKKYHKPYKFWMIPNAFIHGERCPYDRNIYKHYEKRVTLPQYNKVLSKKSNGKLRAVKLYHKKTKRSHILIATIKCKNCHKSFTRQAYSLLHTKVARCPYCDNHGNNMKPQKQFEHDLIRIRGYQYVPGIYIWDKM